MSELQDLFEKSNPIPKGVTRCGDHYAQTEYMLIEPYASGYAERFKGFIEGIKHQQAIIDNLKAQLNNMEACYIEKKKEVEACAALVGQWREKRMGGCSDYARGGLHSRQDCADDLEKALRGDNDLLTDARQKAEDQINNGARLTKHQIDLRGAND